MDSKYQNLKLGEGQWEIVSSSFPRKLEMVLAQTTAVLLFPSRSESICPYMALHIPDFKVSSPEDISNCLMLKDGKSDDYSITLEMAMDYYRSLLVKTGRRTELGAYIFSGTSQGKVDEALFNYFSLCHEVMIQRLGVQTQIILDPRYGYLIASELPDRKNHFLYSIGTRHFSTLGQGPSLRPTVLDPLSPQSYH